jgi:hypothetical protein
MVLLEDTSALLGLLIAAVGIGAEYGNGVVAGVRG